MEQITKNYIDPITGDLVIGGGLIIKEGATVDGLAADPLTAAGAAALGGVKAANAGAGDTVECKINTSSKKLMVPAYPKAANLAASTAEDVAGLAEDHNALLVKLKAAGLMAGDA